MRSIGVLAGSAHHTAARPISASNWLGKLATLRGITPGCRDYADHDIPGQCTGVPKFTHIIIVTNGEVFRIGIETLKHMAHIGVGMEPVAVAARTDDEVWVVSVSSMRKGHPLADSAHGTHLRPRGPGSMIDGSRH